MKKHINYQPLIIEQHPKDYNGYEFITLVKYNGQNYLTIVDNIVNEQLIVYVLDFCDSLNINEQEIIVIANDWYENNRDNYPISIEFSKKGYSANYAKLIRCFPTEYIARIIGPIYQYNMKGPIKIKRRKKKSIPSNIEFIDKTI